MSILYFDRAVYYLKIQNYKKALDNIAWGMDWQMKGMDIFFSMKEYFTNSNLFDERMFNEIFSIQLKAQETKNYILLMDCYESRLLPILYEIQKYIIFNEKDIETWQISRYDITDLEVKNKELYDILQVSSDEMEDLLGQYSIEFALDGSTTVNRMEGGAKYLHSNLSPLQEAFQLANSWYDQNKVKYIIYGIGMGYHVNALIDIDGMISIEVFESSSDMLKLAREYNCCNVFTGIPSININYDPDLSKLESCLEKMTEDTKFVVYSVSLTYIKDKDTQDKLQKLINKYCI